AGTEIDGRFSEAGHRETRDISVYEISNVERVFEVLGADCVGESDGARGGAIDVGGNRGSALQERHMRDIGGAKHLKDGRGGSVEQGCPGEGIAAWGTDDHEI